jgi:hypothetical protein
MLRLHTACACLFFAGSLLLIPGLHAAAAGASAPGGRPGHLTWPADALATHDAGTKYAVLITGYGSGAPYLNTLGFLFNTLVGTYGFDKKNVYVLYGNNYWDDFDGDHQNDIDYSATRANVFAVFDTLAWGRDLGGDDLVFVYLGDHGSQRVDTNESTLCLYWDYEYLEASEVDSLFTTLEHEDVVNEWPVLLGVFDQCYSGGFVDAMTAYSRRAVCSASKASEESNAWVGSDPNNNYESDNYKAFTYYWIAAIAGQDPYGGAVDADANDDGHVSFDEAFQYAKAHDEYATSGTETPQYWDCSDGFGQRVAVDGTQLGSPFLGIMRGRPHHTAFGGPDVWGDGGTGNPSGSGVVDVEAGGALTSAPAGGGGGGGRELYARVHNTGTEPVTGALVRFYYGLPSIIASANDTSLHYLGSATLGTLMPGDTARAGPVPLAALGPNPYGQPYWKIFATIEAPQTPMESGWVDEDLHTAIENYHRGTSLSGEPVELQYRVENPEPEAKRIVLKLVRNTLPPGWQLTSSPALGETLEVAAGQTLLATLTLSPDAIHGPMGVVTVEEDLCNPFTGCWTHCLSDTDSTFVSEGGYIRTTGGISFEVTAPYNPTPTLFADFSASWTNGAVLLTWWGQPEAGATFQVARKGPSDADFVTLASALVEQSGANRYRCVDRDVTASGDYAYQVAYRAPGGATTRVGAILVRAGAPEWRLSLGRPNPSAGTVTLEYSLPFRTPVTVAVYDIAGRCLQRTDLGEQGPGAYTFVWDGSGSRGETAPPGVYLLRLRTRGGQAERRVVIVR